MGAWGHGMRASDTALDALGPYSRLAEEDDREIITLPTDALRALLDALAIHGPQGLLGVAEFLAEHGVADVFTGECQRLILAAIDGEMQPPAIDCWREPEGRLAALARFQRWIVVGSQPPEDQEATEEDNAGLFCCPRPVEEARRSDDPMPYMVVSMQGGVIQEIYCDKPVGVWVVDWDDEQPVLTFSSVASLACIPPNTPLGLLLAVHEWNPDAGKDNPPSGA